MRSGLLLIGLLSLVPLAGGCGSGGPGATPEATAQAWLGAVQKGDARAVAALYDYHQAAQQQNPDWEDIPRGQRDLIVGKLIAERAEALTAQLPAWQQALAGATVAQAQIAGDRATVTLSNGQELALLQREGRWYLSS